MSGATLYFLSEWAIRLWMLVYVPQRRSPASARAWLIFIFVIPWVGLVCYAVFGRPRLPKRRLEMHQQFVRLIQTVGAEIYEPYVGHPSLPADYQHAILLAKNLGKMPIVGGNQVELLPDYDAAVDRLVSDIDESLRHVHLLYYIFADDATGWKVISALKRAVARGVVCRVLLDSMGSKKWRARTLSALREAGVEAVAVLPFRWFSRERTRFDLRNHRKIAVIDGAIAHVGSQNLVDADFKPGILYKDLVARVNGPAVLELQTVFLADYVKETGHWNLAESPVHKQTAADAVRLEGLFPTPTIAGDALAQVLPSGPGFPNENNQRLLVTLFYAAQSRIVVSTPYFVPDDAILQAMQTAVQRGVEVHLIVSRKADQVLVGLAQRSYYETLLESGVRIHEYLPGLLHAKHATIDDSVAVIGSSNLDIRSFQLNAEVLLLVYDKKVAGDLYQEQLANMRESEPLDGDAWKARPFPVRLGENLARLVDSVL